MKLLLHMCCAPCTIYSLKVLTAKAFSIVGYFYPHNIHPYTECQKRAQTLSTYAALKKLTVIFPKTYEPERFFRAVTFREANRCDICYYERLHAAARIAKKGKFDYFSTTLLYSKFQKHDRIRQIGEAVGKETGVPFFYEDFRTGWKEGIDTSKQLKMYRQPYCGCLYSEKERYWRDGGLNFS